MSDSDLLTERLLRLIDEGRRTATYKLALLLALIDTAAMSPEQATIGTRTLAERVLELYFRQTRPYVSADGTEQHLRQITANDSPLLRAVDTLRVAGDAAGHRTLHDIPQGLALQYRQTVDKVEDTFVRYPIPLLQVIGSHNQPFLYQAGWPVGTNVVILRRQQRDHIELLDGVADRLVVLGPLLRPLIELHWARDVARWTGVNTEEDRLRAHLFGSDRVSFPADLRHGLVALQNGNCFYCNARLGTNVQVDHFLAWSRYPNNAVENLVVADRCNGDKSNHLAAARHARRWLQRNNSQATVLTELAASTDWASDAQRSIGHVRSTYSHLAPGTPLWLTGKDFVEADGPLDLA